MTIERESQRILILMPTGRDGPASSELLERFGISTRLCATLSDLMSALAAGAAAALIAEEALDAQELAGLVEWVENQPTWSDLPFILLTSTHLNARAAVWRQRLTATLRNVSMLERPIQGLTLTSTVQAALRARLRQYEVRALLEAKMEAAQRLEAIVLERTQALEKRNAELQREMAERARAEDTLRQVQKMDAVGRLSGGIAHDFNNLLQSVSGNFELIRRVSDNGSRVRLWAEAGLRSADRGAKLTAQLLAFSRAQQIEAKPLIVSDLIFRLHELLIRTLGPLIDIFLDLDSDRVPVLADATQLEMAVLNLAINARDAMPNGGKLTIATRAVDILSDAELQRGQYVELSVTDTGAGMPPDVVSHAFDPFYTTKETGKGTGLGLSQVYGMARQGGGTARIESEPGRGTVVRVWLPRTTAPVASPASLLPREADRPARSGTVLVVDDDAAVRGVLVDALRTLGYDVAEATDGSSGLRLLEESTPDIMVVDFAMPGLNGAEVAKAARARLPSLPIILATGYAETGIIEELAGKATPVLRKPFRIDQLQVLIADAIEKTQGSW